MDKAAVAMLVEAIVSDTRTPREREKALHILETLYKVLPTTHTVAVFAAIKTLE